MDFIRSLLWVVYAPLSEGEQTDTNSSPKPKKQTDKTDNSPLNDDFFSQQKALLKETAIRFAQVILASLSWHQTVIPLLTGKACFPQLASDRDSTADRYVIPLLTGMESMD